MYWEANGTKGALLTEQEKNMEGQAEVFQRTISILERLVPALTARRCKRRKGVGRKPSGGCILGRAEEPATKKIDDIENATRLAGSRSGGEKDPPQARTWSK